ncbi:MAG: hypothetical protein QM682_09015 [Paracoccus sp. (in: a-proteobacteria)]|uniref:capsular polysaccharide export protein, LipB/KpsS family n=1 Tax=Paracoccus sp. TaxID=267 RepID=UPI0039E27403
MDRPARHFFPCGLSGNALPAAVVFHLPPKWVAHYRGQKHLALYTRLEDVLAARGGRVRVVPHRHDQPIPPDHDLHLVENGFSCGPGVLNATLAYIAPYWHVDPQGVLANSSIGARDFDQRRIAIAGAMTFFRQMNARLVVPRRSRYGQSPEVEDIPSDAIAVFLQGTFPHRRGAAICSTVEMLRAVARGAGGRPVLVKPHPHPEARRSDVRDILTAQEEGCALIPTNANIHDILARCVATVSFNSAVALEGFLHRKPAILFGSSDFHHWSDPVADPAEFPQVLARALTRRSGYAQFLHWYFNMNCVNIDAPGFADRILGIFAAMGFDAARLGLAGPDG